MSAAEAPVRRTSADEAAGEVGGLFARHGRMVYGVCRSMLRDAHEAEDATQQVFLSAHRALLGGASIRDAGGWLATIARNECRARIAAGMRRPPSIADVDLEAIPDTGDDLARQAHREQIRDALAALPERQREAVVLRYLYGLRYGEVATALGLSKPATEALLFRARRAMRTSLRPVAGAALAVPVAVRDQLALALPGFEERAAPVALGVGAAGGVLAKLAAGGAGVKVATATVAVAMVGAVGTVGPDRTVAPRAQASIAEPSDRPGRSRERDDSSGRSEETVSRDDDRSGSRSGRDDDDRDERESEGSSGESGRSDDDAERRDDDADDRSESATSGSARPGSGGADDRDGVEDVEATADGSRGSDADDELQDEGSEDD